MITQDIQRQVVDDYLSKTMFIKDICLKYNISSYIFHKILTNNNIELYNPRGLYPQNQRKYPVNDAFFSSENANMAYILGILASDGTVRKDRNEIKLTLSSIDKDYLGQLQQLVGGREIKIYKDKAGHENATWIFTSQQIKQDLAKYGIVPNKTFTLLFPKMLNQNYWIDFIRGYFDGDGSISTAGPSAIRWQVCSASKDVLETISNFFYNQYKINRAEIYCRNDGLYYIQYSTVPTRQIFNILYYNGCLCLPRKFEKYQSLIRK